MADEEEARRGDPAGKDGPAARGARSEDEEPPEEKLERSVDEEWKAQARREKAKLEEEVEERARHRGAEEGAGREMPPADFLHLVSGMAAQVLMQLGAIENPLQDGEKKVDLAAARYSIDVLQMLAEKTKGNLAEEEDKYLRAALHDLRMRFVETAGSPPSKTGKAGS